MFRDRFFLIVVFLFIAFGAFAAGNLIVTGNLQVDGNSTVNDLQINGNATVTDLQVDGNATVNGKITSPKTIQAGIVNDGPNPVSVTFNVPFDTIPIVVASPVKNSSGDGKFVVNIKSITNNGFDFITVNNVDGGVHNVAEDQITWIAIAP